MTEYEKDGMNELMIDYDVIKELRNRLMTAQKQLLPGRSYQAMILTMQSY